MAVKSIIDVEIDKDGSFKKFKALFDEYKEEVKKLPGAWQQSGDKINENKETFEGIVAAMLAQSELTRRLLLEQRETNQTVERTDHLWGSIAKSTKSVAANILGATTSLLRWGAITGAISGVAGGGGLFGLDRLANTVGAGRRSSQGLGIGYGEQQAFETNFQRLVDSHGFLSGVNESLTDYSKRSALYGAGLGEGDIQGKDTGQVAVEALDSIRRLVKRTPTEGLAQLSESRQLGTFGLSVEDLKRLKVTSDDEYASIRNQFDPRAKAFDLPDSTQKAWQDLAVQFTNSWTKIENTFVKGLVGLAGPLTHLGDVFSDTAAAFLSNPHLKEWIDDFGKGIESLAHFLGSEDFGKDVRTFADAVKDLARGARHAADYLGLTDTPAPAPSSIPEHAPQPGDPRNLWYKTITPGGTDTDKNNFLTQQEKSFGLPSGELDAVWQAESSRGKNPGASPAGALGDFQFMSDTAKQYGVTDRRDFFQSAQGAAEYLRDLQKKYGGDSTKALAAYNWGPSNLDNDIKTNGADWRNHLPNETSAYLNKVTVTIQNNTGGNAVTSVSQLPQ